jgi:hypothetical protein
LHEYERIEDFETWWVAAFRLSCKKNRYSGSFCWTEKIDRTWSNLLARQMQVEK